MIAPFILFYKIKKQLSQPGMVGPVPGEVAGVILEACWVLSNISEKWKSFNLF